MGSRELEPDKKGTPPGRVPHWHILVVEDDRGLEPVIKAILQSIDPGAKIDWYASVDELVIDIKLNWRALRAYDLIIADILLPGSYDGLDLWRRCRFNCPLVSFLIMSGLTLKELERRMNGTGTLPAFLAKPFDLAECARVIRGMLEARGDPFALTVDER